MSEDAKCNWSETHRDTLLRPLQVVSGIVERRHTLPILANILIRKDGEKVSFLSTDIEVQITTHAEIGSGGDVTATTVAARKCYRHLACPAGRQRCDTEARQQKMTVQAGKSRFSFANFGCGRIPNCRSGRTFQRQRQLAAKSFEALVQHGTHFSMAQQDIRYYLNGLLLVVDGKT